MALLAREENYGKMRKVCQESLRELALCHGRFIPDMPLASVLDAVGSA